MDNTAVQVLGVLMPLVLIDSPSLGRAVRRMIEVHGEEATRRAYEILAEIKPTVVPGSGPAPAWDEVSAA